MARTENDIQRIMIDTEVPGLAGWGVIVSYKDGKKASFSIEELSYKLFDHDMPMLELTFASIRKQLGSGYGQ